MNMSLHGEIPLILLYLITPFFKTKLWDKTILDVFFDLKIIHHSICGFSRSMGKSSFTTNNP
jgi:hypothetical protein